MNYQTTLGLVDVLFTWILFSRERIIGFAFQSISDQLFISFLQHLGVVWGSPRGTSGRCNRHVKPSSSFIGHILCSLCMFTLDFLVVELISLVEMSLVLGYLKSWRQSGVIQFSSSVTMELCRFWFRLIASVELVFGLIRLGIWQHLWIILEFPLNLEVLVGSLGTGGICSVQFRHGLLFWLFLRTFLLPVEVHQLIDPLIIHPLGKILMKKGHSWTMKHFVFS